MTPLAKARVFSIGTELTRGEINNTNATWLAERLTASRARRGQHRDRRR